MDENNMPSTPLSQPDPARKPGAFPGIGSFLYLTLSFGIFGSAFPLLIVLIGSATFASFNPHFAVIFWVFGLGPGLFAGIIMGTLFTVASQAATKLEFSLTFWRCLSWGGIAGAFSGYSGTQIASYLIGVLSKDPRMADAGGIEMAQGIICGVLGMIVVPIIGRRREKS